MQPIPFQSVSPGNANLDLLKQLYLYFLKIIDIISIIFILTKPLEYSTLIFHLIYRVGYQKTTLVCFPGKQFCDIKYHKALLHSERAHAIFDTM